MTEVELTEGQNARANECGSCIFFERHAKPEIREIKGGPSFEEVEIWRGRCGWKPPPWTIGTLGNDARDVLDTDRCSLYRTSGATFVQKHRWRVAQDA